MSALTSELRLMSISYSFNAKARVLEAAERIDRLERRLEIEDGLKHDGIDARDETIRQLEREVAELREALEFYATQSHYFEACLPLQHDMGQRARDALKSPPAQGGC